MLETQQQWQQRISLEIWAEIRNRLFVALRYLSGCISAFSFSPQESLSGVATDGKYLYFQTQSTIEIFEKNPNLLARQYLHLVLHAMFRHLFQTEGKEPRLWGLCCDIAVESVIDTIPNHLFQRPLTWTRTQTYQTLKEFGGILSAGSIYSYYLQNPLSIEELEKLEKEFRTDDHSCWPWQQQNHPAVMQLAGEWQKRAKAAQTQRSSQAKKETGEKDNLDNLLADSCMPRRSYREFLKKFCILREELRLDMDAFDTSYYTLGLEYYGNIPLIEPTETKESFKVYELAIAIDTSMSCAGDLVKGFLQETFSILQQTDSFFHKIHLRILQADNKIQQDHKITCQEEMQAYIQSLTLKGGGGTDFRPVFTYLDYLCQRHEFHHLAGVLYFTDGKGIYPKKRPPWNTAFLFLEGQYDDKDLPAWAMKQVLYPQQWKEAQPLGIQRNPFESS